MEFVKEAKPQIMAIIIFVFFLFATVFIYFSSANIGYKKGFGVSATELVK